LTNGQIQNHINRMHPGTASELRRPGMVTLALYREIVIVMET
jgi:hypothetical protein